MTLPTSQLDHPWLDPAARDRPPTFASARGLKSAAESSSAAWPDNKAEISRPGSAAVPSQHRSAPSDPWPPRRHTMPGGRTTFAAEVVAGSEPMAEGAIQHWQSGATHGAAYGFHSLLQKLVNELTAEHERELSRLRSEVLQLRMRVGVDSYTAPDRSLSLGEARAAWKSTEPSAQVPKASQTIGSAQRIPRYSAVVEHFDGTGMTLPAITPAANWKPSEAVASGASHRGRPHARTQPPTHPFGVAGPTATSSRPTTPLVNTYTPNPSPQGMRESIHRSREPTADMRVRSSSPIWSQQAVPVRKIAAPHDSRHQTPDRSRWVLLSPSASMRSPVTAIPLRPQSGSPDRGKRLGDSNADNSTSASASTGMGTSTLASHPQTLGKSEQPGRSMDNTMHTLYSGAGSGGQLRSAPPPPTAHSGIAVTQASMHSNSNARQDSTSPCRGLGSMRSAREGTTSPGRVSIRDLDSVCEEADESDKRHGSRRNRTGKATGLSL